MDTQSESQPLDIFFLPYIAPGHMTPLSEMARLFAARRQNVTIITTPSNALLLNKSIAKDTSADLHITVHTIPFPSEAVGLPDGIENLFYANDIETASKLYKGLTIMQNDIEQFVIDRRPDCIVSDMFYPWTADLAIKIGIPRLVFHATCIFAMCMKDAARREDSPHRRVSSDYETFSFPNLPHAISMTRAQLPDYVRTPSGYTQLMEQWREAELKSFGVLVNNYAELEQDYIDHYKKIMNHTIWHIGPSTKLLRDTDDKVRRSHDAVVTKEECFNWLNTKNPDSILYICFGSACRFPDDQLYELATGLMNSGYEFIWVVFGKEDDKDDLKWLPEGFKERMEKENKGMIIRGWAPQVLILDHPAVGGFMTHCGWNSVLEGFTAGLPMITWPLYAEHFYNEKFVTQVHETGVEVGVEDWNLWVDAGKKLVKRENIEKAVRKVMESSEMRRRAREIGEKAVKAVDEGGSSHKNLTVFIEEIKKLRSDRK